MEKRRRNFRFTLFYISGCLTIMWCSVWCGKLIFKELFTEELLTGLLIGQSIIAIPFGFLIYYIDNIKKE